MSDKPQAGGPVSMLVFIFLPTGNWNSSIIKVFNSCIRSNENGNDYLHSSVDVDLTKDAIKPACLAQVSTCIVRSPPQCPNLSTALINHILRQLYVDRVTHRQRDDAISRLNVQSLPMFSLFSITNRLYYQ